MNLKHLARITLLPSMLCAMDRAFITLDDFEPAAAPAAFALLSTDDDGNADLAGMAWLHDESLAEDDTRLNEIDSPAPAEIVQGKDVARSASPPQLLSAEERREKNRERCRRAAVKARAKKKTALSLEEAIIQRDSAAWMQYQSELQELRKTVTIAQFYGDTTPRTRQDRNKCAAAASRKRKKLRIALAGKFAKQVEKSLKHT